MCKKLKFDHPNKCYMHNPAPVLDNDFDIHTDHLISARRPDLIIINKKRELAKEPVLKNVAHKIFWEFEIQSDLLILTRRQNLWDYKKKESDIL